MKIGYYAPPPGSPTGVADYADTLFHALAASTPPNTTLQRDAATSDLGVYHLGNNRLHAGIYAKAIANPGVAVIHDAVLHHFMLGALTEAEYIAEFVYNYGEWSRHIAEEMWRERAGCAINPRYFRYAMLRRAVENQRAVIVHNPGAAEIVKQHGAANIHVIPHFFEPQEIPDAAATERFRQSLNTAPGTALVGMFGYLRETKRVLACIRTFRRLHAVCPNTALLIAGEVVSTDLRRILAGEPPHPAIHRLGHLNEDEFRLAGAAVDCCLNLRYPPAGETSGIAVRLMGIGKPVILTEGPETADIPANACLRVPPGAEEATVLFDQMALIANHPAIARQIGREAARHIQTRHTLENAAKLYWQVIESMEDSPAQLTSAPESRYVAESSSQAAR